ncbi:MAG: 2-oxoacid:acceptor oxidoreductase family protein [Clostridiales bacterium]|jgi:2-oxoglutarate ferredoxin oxidoreductase subunit gamma|nr:2-oxoacid:acceptor oxidoreductase family protein [Clostridiales bacterium]
MTTHSILLSGFGGQGILFAGKLLAYMGLIMDKNVSWLPSYGPEMRGGTANCNVIISDDTIGSPIINNPSTLICMNKPSFNKFVPMVEKNGLVVLDSSLIDIKGERGDINFVEIPATQIATDNQHPKLANMVMLGRTLKELNLGDESVVISALKKTIPNRKIEMLEVNKKAILAGYNFT